MDKLLIIDGNSIANRAFYAMPFFSNKEGKPSGAVYGFLNILIKILLQEKPTHVAVAFDHARQTFRNQIYSEYKGQRKPTPPELIEQFPVLKEMLKNIGIQTFEYENIEADDIIGTISKNTSCQKILLSGDRDLFQLIDDKTLVFFPRKGVSEADKVTLENLKDIYGVSFPSQVIELKALMGDTSDNIPGVRGVGEKTALSLIEKYDNLNNIYKNLDDIKGKLKENLIDYKNDAFMSKELATIKTDCDFEFNFEACKFSLPFSTNAYNFFKEWDFNSITKNDSLFEETIKIEKEINKVKKTLLTQQVLQEIIKKNITEFAYNFETLEFYFGGKESYYLQQNYDMFGSDLAFEDVLKCLKKLFEDAKVLKITFSSKEDMHTLDKYGIKLTNFFDLSIASYVVNAGAKANVNERKVCEYKNLMESFLKQIKENELEFIFYNIEMPLVSVLKNMEEYGFKINQNRLEEISIEIKEKLEKLSKQIYEEAGEEFNINSPKQVAHILFDKLGIKSYNNRKQSTRVDVLDELRYIPIVEHILTHRKISKLNNTYIEVYKNICKTSGDIIHTKFNQTLTSTGRLSSSEPNLQNIPTRDEEGRKLRKIFISKFENGKIISADYNQIELRLLADMSNEENLINAYNNSEDIHSLTASQIFSVPQSKVTKSMRREAKAVNFGIIYGISDYGLSQDIKVSVDSAKKYIASYFETYPKVKAFMDGCVKYAKENALIRTKFGRIRKIPEINASKYMTRTFGERVAMNMPLQGTASDIIKLAMLEVFEEIKKQKLKSQLILQIHDELIVDTFPGEETKVKKILLDKMENIAKLKVPLIISVGEGESLYDC